MRKGEIDGRIDPNFYLPIFRVSDRSLFKTLNDVSKKILHPPEYPREFSETGLQLIRSQNVRPLGMSLNENPAYFSEEFLKDKKVVFAQRGDVLIVRSGVNAGDVAVIEEDLKTAIVGADTLLLRTDGKVIPKFLQVYFHTNFGKRQILRHTTGATNKHLNSENLKKVLVPDASFEVQRNTILLFEESLVAKRTKEFEAKSLLEGIDAYLLERLGIETPIITETKKTFFTRASKLSGGRFDPFYHKTEFEELEKALMTGRYEINKLKDVADFQAGYAFSSDDYVENSDCHLVTIKNISKNEINLDNSTFLPSEYFQQYRRFQIERDDLLIAMTGATIGKVGLFNLEEKALLNQRVGIIKPNLVNEIYLMALLNNETYQKFILRNSNGGAQPNISETDIMKLQIPFPPLEIQEEIAVHIQSIRERARELERDAQAEVERAKQEVERMILGEVPADE